MSLDFDDENEANVLLLVHDTKPPFLQGMAVNSKQVGLGWLEVFRVFFRSSGLGSRVVGFPSPASQRQAGGRGQDASG